MNIIPRGKEQRLASVLVRYDPPAGTRAHLQLEREKTAAAKCSDGGWYGERQMLYRRCFCMALGGSERYFKDRGEQLEER